MQNRIAFDLDGVLVNLMPTFEDILWQVHGAVRERKDRFRMDTSCNLTDAEIWDIFRDVYKCVNLIEISEGAEELLTKIYEKTKEPIYIVTARPTDSVGLTHRLVSRFCKVPYVIAFTNGSGNGQKAQYLTGYNYFVEDRRKTARQLGSIGKNVFLVDRPHNQFITKGLNIERIGGVADLIPRLSEIIWGGH